MHRAINCVLRQRRLGADQGVGRSKVGPLVLGCVSQNEADGAVKTLGPLQEQCEAPLQSQAWQYRGSHSTSFDPAQPALRKTGIPGTPPEQQFANPSCSCTEKNARGIRALPIFFHMPMDAAVQHALNELPGVKVSDSTSVII